MVLSTRQLELFTDGIIYNSRLAGTHEGWIVPTILAFG